MSNAFQSAANGLSEPLFGAPGLRVLLLLACLVPLLMQAGCEDAGRPITLDVLRQRIDDQVQAYEESSGGHCGVYIVDLRNDRAIKEIEIDKPLKPGSNMKLLTSAFVLAELGGDFEWITSVYRLGDDIVVVGDGDPGMGASATADEPDEVIYAEFDRRAAAIKEKVGKDFTGDLIMCSQLDLSASRPPAWAPGIYHFSWAPPTGGLNYHDNLLQFRLNVENGKANVDHRPKSRFFKVVNKLQIGETEQAILTANDDDTQFELTGTVTAGTKSPFYMPVNEPELFVGRILAERLVLSGVPFDGDIRYVKSKDIDLTGAELLYQKKTPLAASLERMNIRSLNMPAECHFLRAGDGTWENTAQLLTTSIIKNYRMNPKGFVIDEGSGISAVAHIAPRELVRLLKAFLEVPSGKLVFESIPRCGIEGTMTSDLTEPEYRGRVRGKIGHTMQGYCLSGYVMDKAGKPTIIYSIMANDMAAGEETNAKPLQNTICRMLVDYVDTRN